MAIGKKTDDRAMKVQDFIANTFAGASTETWAELEEIAKLTALRRDSSGEYYISNLWRGPMLYSLVMKLKPRVILELGTGRGYGAFSMAKGLVDSGGDGQLITVDRTPSDRPMEWPYVSHQEESITIESSLDVFWQQHLSTELRDRIEFRQGDTARVHSLLSDHAGEIDLVFIDSDHTYNGVALDFLSTHSIAAKNAVFVFDDYSTTSGYGIRKLVDDELRTSYSVQVVDMELTAAHDISVDHMMAVVNADVSEINARFTRPSDLRFRYLLVKRWVRSSLVGIKRVIKR